MKLNDMETSEEQTEVRSTGLWSAMSLVGLIGGITLLFGGIIFASSSAAGDTGMSITWWLLELIRIAGVVLGIMSLVTYKDMPKAGPVCVLVGGAVALLPLLGWAGGIVMIVGGGIAISKKRLINA